jgi:hypothetical protein
MHLTLHKPNSTEPEGGSEKPRDEAPALEQSTEKPPPEIVQLDQNVFRINPQYDGNIILVSQAISILQEALNLQFAETFDFNRVPEQIKRAAENFPYTDIHSQAAFLNELIQQGINPTALLNHVQLAQKSHDSSYQEADEFFVDPMIYRVMRGHEVQIFHEISKGGVSRHQGRFAKSIIDDETAIFVADGSHPDIKRLQLDETKSYPLLSKHSPENDQTDKVAYISGIRGLQRLISDNPNHPALSADQAYGAQVLFSMITHTFSLEFKSGIVAAPPGASNEGMLKFTDGTEIEMCNVRLINIIGADVPALLKRGDREVYLGRPVKVFFQNEWHTGIIHDPDSVSGLVGVRCDQKISNGSFLDGHGLTVGISSPDLDLLVPVSSSSSSDNMQGHGEEPVKGVKTKVLSKTDADFIDRNIKLAADLAACRKIAVDRLELGIQNNLIDEAEKQRVLSLSSFFAQAEETEVLGFKNFAVSYLPRLTRAKFMTEEEASAAKDRIKNMTDGEEICECGQSFAEQVEKLLEGKSQKVEIFILYGYWYDNKPEEF